MMEMKEMKKINQKNRKNRYDFIIPKKSLWEICEAIGKC